uniref:zinc finger protein 92 homolog n=1 Tax=Lonchura striata TaxID=40157 RepID=UPI000B4D77C5|nr:zinc finger protein 92 homolog [Lonchura striata domestica]
MDQEEEQEEPWRRHTWVTLRLALSPQGKQPACLCQLAGGELGPLPDHLECTYLQDVLAAGSRGGEEQFGDSMGVSVVAQRPSKGLRQGLQPELPPHPPPARPHRPEALHLHKCSKAFSQSSSLLKQQRVHTGLKLYTCSECRKFFSSSAAAPPASSTSACTRASGPTSMQPAGRASASTATSCSPAAMGSAGSASGRAPTSSTTRTPLGVWVLG